MKNNFFIFFVMGSVFSLWSMENIQVSKSVTDKKFEEPKVLNILNSFNKDVYIKIDYGNDLGFIKLIEYPYDTFFFPVGKAFKFRLNETDLPIRITIWSGAYRITKNATENDLQNSILSRTFDKASLNSKEIYLAIDSIKEKIEFNFLSSENFTKKVNKEEIINACPVTYNENKDLNLNKNNKIDLSNITENITVCGICLEKLSNIEIKLSCNHNNFHSSCLEKWKKLNAICPICRLAL